MEEESENYDVDSTSGLSIAASVIFDPENGCFEIEPEFYKFVQMADEERRNME